MVIGVQCGAIKIYRRHKSYFSFPLTVVQEERELKESSSSSSSAGRRTRCEYAESGEDEDDCVKVGATL